MMKQYKNFIFDFDGTLMDTSAAIMATIRATIERMGLPERSDEQCRGIIGIRTDEAGKHLYPELDISNAEFAKVFREIYPEMQIKYPAKPFDYVTECLDCMWNMHHPMAIASSRRKSSIFEFLSELGATNWFRMIVGAEDVTNGKPSPEPVLKILEALNWNPNETLVVGDADVDIMMGNAAGCDTCAVTYGNGSLESLKAAHPTHIINSFDEIYLLGIFCHLAQSRSSLRS